MGGGKGVREDDSRCPCTRRHVEVADTPNAVHAAILRRVAWKVITELKAAVPHAGTRLPTAPPPPPWSPRTPCGGACPLGAPHALCALSFYLLLHTMATLVASSFLIPHFPTEAESPPVPLFVVPIPPHGWLHGPPRCPAYPLPLTEYHVRVISIQVPGLAPSHPRHKQRSFPTSGPVSRVPHGYCTICRR